MCRDRNGRCQGTEVEGGKQALPFTHWEGRHGIARGNKAGVWTGDILWGASLCTVQRGLGLYLIKPWEGQKVRDENRAGSTLHLETVILVRMT